MSYTPQASSDTSVEIDRLMIDAYRRMPLAEKARRVSEATRAVDLLALTGIRQRHPGCSDREARIRLAALKYGSDLVRQAFGWAPDARDL